MKILLDANVPKALALAFPGDIRVDTAQQLGWQLRRNGELLLLAHQASFDLVLTRDRSMPWEQNEQNLPLPVIVLNHPQDALLGMGKELAKYVAKRRAEGLKNRFYHFGPPKQRRRFHMV